MISGFRSCPYLILPPCTIIILALSPFLTHPLLPAPRFSCGDFTPNLKHLESSSLPPENTLPPPLLFLLLLPVAVEDALGALRVLFSPLPFLHPPPRHPLHVTLYRLGGLEPVPLCPQPVPRPEPPHPFPNVTPFPTIPW